MSLPIIPAPESAEPTTGANPAPAPAHIVRSAGQTRIVIAPVDPGLHNLTASQIGLLRPTPSEARPSGARSPLLAPSNDLLAGPSLVRSNALSAPTPSATPRAEGDYFRALVVDPALVRVKTPDKPGAEPAKAVTQALNGTYSFGDPATAAVLAAIPEKREGGPVTLTHLQLRSLATTALLSLNDMEGWNPAVPVQDEPEAEAKPVLASVAAQQKAWREPDTETNLDADGLNAAMLTPDGENRVLVAKELNESHIPALPNPVVIRARVDRVLDELFNGIPALKTPGYLVEVPRIGAELDNLDRAVKKMGFPDDPTWRDLLLAGSPATAYQLRPTGVAAGNAIRGRNDGPVTGIAGDGTTVNLPKALADIAYAGSETGHALMLDHYYEAGMLQPGELGRALEREAKLIAESLKVDGNQSADVAGGRILDNLDAVHESVSAVLSEEEIEAPVRSFVVRPEEVRAVLNQTMNSLARQPELTRDELVLERVEFAAGAYQGLRLVEEAKLSMGTFGLTSSDDLADARVWRGAKTVFGSNGFDDIRTQVLDLPEADLKHFWKARSNEQAEVATPEDQALLQRMAADGSRAVIERFESAGAQQAEEMGRFNPGGAGRSNARLAINPIISDYAVNDIAISYVEGWIRGAMDDERQANKAIQAFRSQIPEEARFGGFQNASNA